MSTKRTVPSVVQYASKLRSNGDQATDLAVSDPMSPLKTSAPWTTFQTLSRWSPAQQAISCSLEGLLQEMSKCTISGWILRNHQHMQ